MSNLNDDLWLSFIGEIPEQEPIQGPIGGAEVSSRELYPIEPDDPIIAYFQTFPEAVELENVHLDSRMLDRLMRSGVKLVIPLFHQEKLVGLISLGKRRNEPEKKPDEQILFAELTNQTRPAFQIAEWMHQHESELLEGEAIDRELKYARIIQEALLPQAAPELADWVTMAYWQPPREVGGDFYDFIKLDDGKIGLVIGDVSDRGLPATLVMAFTKKIIHAVVGLTSTPGQVLSKVNNLLYDNIPANVFVTCLYAILDPKSGVLVYANAGHNLPICLRLEGIEELRATGMPLGLLPEMEYEAGATTLEAGESLLLYSDGLVEAHNQSREMFGIGRLKELVEGYQSGESLADTILGNLCDFTGDEWEQEDDIMFVLIRNDKGKDETENSKQAQNFQAGNWKVLGEFSLPSESGLERVASEKVIELLKDTALETGRVDRLKTAVAEATMNAIEHGNRFDREKPVIIKVASSDSAISVHISDRGGEQIVPNNSTPDLEAKLAGLESPRGWGMFIIRNMVDHVEIISRENRHTVILTMFIGGHSDAS